MVSDIFSIANEDSNMVQYDKARLSPSMVSAGKLILIYSA